MRNILKIIWKIYNLIVNIFGHLCVLALLIAIGYYLHTQDLLYLVLLSIIGLLILIMIIICINASITKKKLKATQIDTKNFKNSVENLKNNIK